jgi:hypothetical protein
VYFSSVVTFCSEAADAEDEPGATVVVVVVLDGAAGGGVDDCARNPMLRSPAMHRRAELFWRVFVVLRFIISVC